MLCDPSSDSTRLSIVFRLKGTVLLKIWKPLVFMILYTVIIITIHHCGNGIEFDFPQTLIPVLGVVTGLMLAFRTNTAYDRYWEGRRLWATMTQNLRTLTRLIWVGVKEPSVREIIQKKTAVNIVMSFPFATKCYLREEYAYDNEEFQDLIKHLPKFVLSNNNSHPPSDSFISKGGTIRKQQRIKNKFKAYDVIPVTNIPVELSYHITSYIEYLRENKLCDGALLNNMTAAVTNLMDCVTGFERILRTPIPLAYSVHLQHAVWLYLLVLPYQLVGLWSWWTIPAVSAASFSLLGILEIGWEIENPFGYDENDLPLDDYCKGIKSEIQMITRNCRPRAESWLSSSDNLPFAPVSTLSANELSEQSVEVVNALLAKQEDGAFEKKEN